MAMGIDELLASLNVQRDAHLQRQLRNRAERELILNKAREEGRSNLTADEDARVVQLQGEREDVKRDIAGVEQQIEYAETAKREETEAAAQLSQRTPTGTARPAMRDGLARIGSEERTYRADVDRTGRLFLLDVLRSVTSRDIEAETRLAAHMHEERVERAGQQWRAVGTGAFTGLVVPQYLTDLYAPAVAALRPFADICNPHELPPDGMTVNISRITTSTGVALQATEGTGVQNTDADDTLLTENVQTAAGQQLVSRQAIDRGVGIDDVLMDDLFRRYSTALDSTLLNQATTGLTAVATAVTYTDTSPTAPELYPKILGALAGSEAALLAQAIPDYIVMHSRRWYWLSSQLVSTWPFISQPGIPTQAAGSNQAVGYNQGIRGRLPNGLLVVVDNNVGTAFGTSEDEVYVVPSREAHLWEDPSAPVFIRAEVADTLQVRLVLYGYFAYSFRRYPGGMQKVGGSGLITPTF
jgi:hypothetical protein